MEVVTSPLLPSSPLTVLVLHSRGVSYFLMPNAAGLSIKIALRTYGGRWIALPTTDHVREDVYNKPGQEHSAKTDTPTRREDEWKRKLKEQMYLQRWTTKFIWAQSGQGNFFSTRFNDSELGGYQWPGLSLSHQAIYEAAAIPVPRHTTLRPSPYTPPLIFSLPLSNAKLAYCKRGRLLDTSDHAYFALLLIEKYINSPQGLHQHIAGSFDEASSTCDFYPRDTITFQENTISMGYATGKNLAQKFPSPTQRTKKSVHSITCCNKVMKYTYVCIPDKDNKWFEHRWKIGLASEANEGEREKEKGFYYLCVDVPGTGVKRKRTTHTVVEKSKTQKIVNTNADPLLFTWLPPALPPSPSLPSPPSPPSSLPAPSLPSTPPNSVPSSPIPLSPASAVPYPFFQFTPTLPSTPLPSTPSLPSFSSSLPSASPSLPSPLSPVSSPLSSPHTSPMVPHRPLNIQKNSSSSLRFDSVNQLNEFLSSLCNH